MDDFDKEEVSTLGKSFQTSLENGLLSDYEIITNSSKIKCHRIILASRSKFFLNLFQSNMIDSNENSITLTDFDDNLIKIAIEFIYTDTLKTKKCSGAELIELMNVGNYLEIQNFSNIISNKIENILSKENIFEIYKKAFEFNFEEVQKTCIDFFIINFKELIAHPKFLELPKNSLANLFKSYSEI